MKESDRLSNSSVTC